MVRTQIQLTEGQAQKLQEMAAKRNVSLAELVRQAVDHLLQTESDQSKEERWRRARASFGRFSSTDRANVSEEHDAYLAEAYDV